MSDSKVDDAETARGKETLAKLNYEQRDILQALQESGSVPISALYPETKDKAIELFDSLKAHGIVEIKNDTYVFTEHGHHVAVANLNRLIQQFNEGSEM